MAEKRTTVQVKQEDDAYPVASSEGEKDTSSPSRKRRRIKQEPLDGNHADAAAGTSHAVAGIVGNSQPRYPQPILDTAAAGALEEIGRNLAPNREMLERGERFITETVVRLKNGDEIWERMPETQGALQEVLIWRGMKAASMEQAPAAARPQSAAGIASCPDDSVFDGAIVDKMADAALKHLRPRLGSNAETKAATEAVYQTVARVKNASMTWENMPQDSLELRNAFEKVGLKAATASIKHNVEAVSTVVIERIRKELKGADENVIHTAESYLQELILALENGHRPWKKKRTPQTQKDLKEKLFTCAMQQAQKQAKKQVKKKRKVKRKTKKRKEKQQLQSRCEHEFMRTGKRVCVVTCKHCSKQTKHELCAHPSEHNLISCRYCGKIGKNKGTEIQKLRKYYRMRRKAEDLKNLQALCLPVAAASSQVICQALNGAGLTPSTGLCVTLVEGAVEQNQPFMKFVGDVLERDSSCTVSGLRSIPFGNHSMQLILANVQMKFDFNLSEDWEGFVQLPQWPMYITLGKIHADLEQQTMELLQQSLVGQMLDTYPHSLAWVGPGAKAEQAERLHELEQSDHDSEESDHEPEQPNDGSDGSEQSEDGSGQTIVVDSDPA